MEPLQTAPTHLRSTALAEARLWAVLEALLDDQDWMSLFDLDPDQYQGLKSRQRVRGRAALAKVKNYVANQRVIALQDPTRGK